MVSLERTLCSGPWWKFFFLLVYAHAVPAVPTWLRLKVWKLARNLQLRVGFHVLHEWQMTNVILQSCFEFSICNDILHPLVSSSWIVAISTIVSFLTFSTARHTGEFHESLNNSIAIWIFTEWQRSIYCTTCVLLMYVDSANQYTLPLISLSLFLSSFLPPPLSFSPVDVPSRFLWRWWHLHCMRAREVPLPGWLPAGRER